MSRRPRIAVLIPCRNEAATIAQVVQDFRAALPGSTVYVYDNDSVDDSGELAADAGAVVRHEKAPGKGGVVRRMFAEVDADIYVLVDGDATYDASRAPELVEALVAGDLDMVTAVRDHEGRDGAYPRGHHLGNRAFNAFVAGLFGARPADMLSGYRAFSRRFVKSFPGTSRGFEIETELTVHALEQRLPTTELPARYFERAQGSRSKLSTYRDGGRILAKMVVLFKDVKPAQFFGGFALMFGVAGLALGMGVVIEFMETRYVSRVPTAILATGLMLLAFIALACGLILDSVARGRREAKRLAYLAAFALPVKPAEDAIEDEVPHAFQLGHFYSPIVDPREAAAHEQSIWRDDDALSGIDLNDSSHRLILQDVFPRYIGAFDYPSEAVDARNEHSYYTNNPAFGWLDARLLFVLLREWRPRRVVEIGSGYSSLLMADVNRRFLDGSVEITCVEPHPPRFLSAGVNGIARLIQQPVQSAPRDVFDRMTEGDVLFIDSSHVAKTGSDVNHLLFEVLPRLVPGVRIHVHDIFFPREYPKEWVIRDNRSWNEQYVVRALLMYSTGFRILFGSSIAYWRHRDLLRTALRQDDGSVFGGGSLWIERIASS